MGDTGAALADFESLVIARNELLKRESKLKALPEELTRSIERTAKQLLLEAQVTSGQQKVLENLKKDKSNTTWTFCTRDLLQSTEKNDNVDGFIAVAAALSESDFVKHLVLGDYSPQSIVSDKKLNDRDLVIILEVLTSVVNTRKRDLALQLDFSNHDIKDAGASAIVKFMKNPFVMITRLQLELNQISDDGVTKIAEVLRTQNDLEYLSLSSVGAECIAALSKNRSIKFLFLYDIRVADEGPFKELKTMFRDSVIDCSGRKAMFIDRK